MTKREQAAQLLEELKEMAAGDAVAMAVVEDMTTKLEDSGIAEKSGNY